MAKLSKSKDNNKPAEFPTTFNISENLGQKGCRCLIDDHEGLAHLRYTGVVGVLPNGTKWGKFSCKHGRTYTRYNNKK